MPTRSAVVGARQVEMLQRLCNAVAVSGDEHEVRNIVLDELQDAAEAFSVDALGNLLVRKDGRRGRRPRVLLDAHMDEVGFMLVAEDGEGHGLYEFETIGKPDMRGLAGKQVVVGKEHAPGVIGAKPIHLSTDEERKRAFPAEVLRVDLGPGAKAKLGELGTFSPNFRRVGPSVMSKALDNRLGVATVIEAMRAAPANIELVAAFTVQEEIGLRGAMVAARAIEVDMAIIVDSVPALDLPMQREGENTSYKTRLGGGPAIYVADGKMMSDARLVEFLVNTATRARIPFQIRQPGPGAGDSSAIQRAGVGIPVVALAIPHRYTHSAISVARIEDWQNTMRLLLAALRRITPQVLGRRL